MNCDDIERLLAEGQPLGREEIKHVSECASCRSLLEVLSTAPEPAGTVTIQVMLAKTAQLRHSVNMLPSDSALIVLTMSIFILFSLLMAIGIGLKGFHRLNITERIFYYSAVLVFALQFSIAAVQTAVPGSKVRVSRRTAIGSSMLGIALLVSAMFRSFALDNFVQQGIPCLRLGCICAALFGAIAAILLRRGYVTNFRATALLISCFAGFSGVAVLSLRCPIQNSAHIIVWHLGAVVLSGLCGLGLGVIRGSEERRIR